MLLEGMHRRLSLFGGAVLWLGHGRREAEQGRIDKNSASRQGSRGGVLLVGDSKYRFCRNAASRRTLTVKMSKHQFNICIEKSTPIGSTTLLPLKSGCAADALASFWRGRGRCAAVAARAITRVVEGARRGRAGPAGKTHADPAHSRTRGAPNSSARPDKGGGATKGETPWLHPTSPAAAS